jgi:hypothetical protein
MAKAKTIRVMLSSRCNDEFPAPVANGGLTLSEIRRDLKTTIESQRVLGQALFEVWINEDAPPADHTADSWETCLEAARDCDVLIVLSNGNAGWAKAGGDIGICHAEYMEGLASARGKVRIVTLPNVDVGKGVQRERNLRFQEYLAQETAFRGGSVTSVTDLKERVYQALTDALITLTQRGVSAAASTRFDMGQALDWTRLDFRQRKHEMERVLQEALSSQDGARAVKGAVILRIGGQSVAVMAHAIPAAFTVAAARELVGRPFLLDHERVDLLKAAHGPVHVIACHRSASETQATTLLGFPDAIVVTGQFGVFVADDIQNVQFVFLVNCRDESQTRHALQRFFEWLGQTGEDTKLASRAASRARIVKVIAAELKSARGA